MEQTSLSLDKSIYDSIVDLKNHLLDSISTMLVFHTRFKGRKTLEKEMQEVINLVETRALDIKMFLQTIS